MRSITDWSAAAATIAIVLPSYGKTIDRVLNKTLNKRRESENARRSGQTYAGWSVDLHGT